MTKPDAYTEQERAYLTWKKKVQGITLPYAAFKEGWEAALRPRPRPNGDGNDYIICYRKGATGTSWRIGVTERPDGTWSSVWMEEVDARAEVR